MPCGKEGVRGHQLSGSHPTLPLLEKIMREHLEVSTINLGRQMQGKRKIWVISGETSSQTTLL